MNKISGIKLLIYCCACLTLWSSESALAYGKSETFGEPVLTTDSLFLPMSTTLLPQVHSLGLGVSIVTSDVFADVYQFNPGIMVSAFYAYRFTPIFSLELSAHALEATRVNDYVRPTGQYPPMPIASLHFEQYHRLAHSLNVGLTTVFTPFAESNTDWSRLQVGVGASIRLAGLISIKNQVNPSGRLDTAMYPKFEIAYTRQTALGINAHLEYVLPLGGMVDMGFRFHGQIFFPPIAVIGDRIPIVTSLRRYEPIPTSINDIALGAAGFGVFFRLGL